jgi:hypothetical protein
MKKSIFISGSMDIKKLHPLVRDTIKKITLSNQYEIFIGDAKGVDSLIQKECVTNNFNNCTIFSIIKNPRNFLSENFNFHYILATEKNARKRQQEKDIAMTKKADSLFVIWDGKSKGSYENILRGIELRKKIEIFFKEEFISQEKITKSYIDNIFSENRLFSATEIVKENIVPKIKNVNDLQNILLNYNILTQTKAGLTVNERFKSKISESLIRGKKILKYRKSLFENISITGGKQHSFF